MKEHAFETFIGAAAQDKSLAAAIAQAVKGRSGIAASQSVADLAASRGYALTVDDVETGRKRLLDTLDQAELPDEALEDVSGGVDPVTIAIFGASTVLALATTGGAVAAGAGLAAGLSAASKDVKKFFSGW